MGSLNSVNLVGNITRDIELKYTSKGTAVCNMGLALNETWTNADGERVDNVTFVDVTLWNKDAENAEKYLVKGQQVAIQGRLKANSWDDKNTGEKRTKLVVNCDRL